MHVVTQAWVNIGSRNGLLPDSARNNVDLSSMGTNFTGMLKISIRKMILKKILSNYFQISQASMS